VSWKRNEKIAILLPLDGHRGPTVAAAPRRIPQRRRPADGDCGLIVTSTEPAIALIGTMFDRASPLHRNRITPEYAAFAHPRR
jgi:hypothetical protein